MHHKKLYEQWTIINNAGNNKLYRREKVRKRKSKRKIICCHRCSDERVYLLRRIRLVIFSNIKNCNVCARARAPKYHQYDRAIDNNNHKYLVHILGSCYCLLAGLSCRFFRYRHHKTNPIITFQFNCVKPVTLTVSRDRRQIYERGNQRAHCTNASNAITMHIFFIPLSAKTTEKNDISFTSIILKYVSLSISLSLSLSYSMAIQHTNVGDK